MPYDIEPNYKGISRCWTGGGVSAVELCDDERGYVVKVTIAGRALGWFDKLLGRRSPPPCEFRLLRAERPDKADLVLDAANDVIGDLEGPRTPAQARLVLALYDYDPKRFALGMKDDCDCECKDECDECMTNDEALAWCRTMAAKDQPTT